MTDKKALVLATLEASNPHKKMILKSHEIVPIADKEHPEDLNPDVIQLSEISDGRFATYVNRIGNDGDEEEVITAEYQLWKDDEATEAGYNPTKGAIATSDPEYKLYRII